MTPLPITAYGNCWINSLDQMRLWGPEDERRKAGRELGMSGNAVSGIKVSDGCLSGYVQQGGQNYHVELMIKTVTRKQVEKYFHDQFYSHTHLTDYRSRTADRRSVLPDALDLVNDSGMTLFPSYYSYRMQSVCRCGQYPGPCIHVWALLYAFHYELNYDPSLLFELHGFHLRQELRVYKRNLNGQMGRIDTFYHTFVPTLEDLSGAASDPAPRLARDVRPQVEGFPNRTDWMLDLMDDQPRFDRRFKAQYATLLKQAQKALQRVVDGKRMLNRAFPRAKVPVNVAAGEPMQAELFTDRWQTLALSLLATPESALAQAHPTARAHYYALRGAIQLVLAGGVAPRLVGDDRFVFRFVWMPTELHESAGPLLRDLERITPRDAVMAHHDYYDIYPSRQALWLLTGYVHMLVTLFSPKSKESDYHSMFFDGQPYLIRMPRERITLLNLSAWVAPLWMAHPTFKPYILVEEPEGEKDYFRVSAALVPPDRPDAPPVTVADYALERGQEAADAPRFFFARLHQLVPEIADATFQCQPGPLLFDSDQILRLMEQTPSLEYAGVRVMLPRSLQDLLKPRLALRVKSREPDELSSLSLNDLLEYDWVLAVGDEEVDLAEFRRMLTLNQDMLRFKSRYILLKGAELGPYRDALMGGKDPFKGNLLHTALAEDYDSHPVILTPEARQAIRRAVTLEPVPLPEGLQATLRPYQERGYAWMYRNLNLGFGSILADDMGLGKTLQTIALILKLKEEGRLEQRKALVVVPTSLLTNWQAEVARFAPSLKVSIYHGHDRSQQAFSADITLTTYGVARGDMETINLYPWRLLVVDEAQNIKNAATKQSRAIVNIKADTRIALSGTPVENRLAEFWSIMQFCNPGYLGSQRQFSARYAKPIQVDKDEAVAERFRRITAPFLLRRLKTDKDIINDLPDKIEKNEYVALQPQQAALYQAVVDEAMRTLSSLDSDDSHHLFRRKGIILQMILALKQVCNHPAQYLKNDDLRPELSGKTEHLLELVQSILDSGDKMLIFTQFRQMGEMLVGFLRERLDVDALFYHGGCTVEQRAEMVRRFQEDPTQRVFVLSLKAAGTGLNLTAATHVIHYDLWWNPAVESQATDRAYRIGQHQNVIVHRFIAHDTFEEKIDNMIQNKRQLADMTVASGEGWIADLTDDELRELFVNY